MNDKIESFYKRWKADNRTIAVVGNGTPSKNYGKEIDKYDIVIRFNLCITKGYEELVGTKTFVQCVGSFTLMQSEQFKEIKNIHPYVWSFYVKDYNYKTPEPNFCLPAKCYYIKAKELLDVRKPTCGFNLLYSMYLNDIKADVFCMDFYKTNPYYTETVAKDYDFFKVNSVKGYDLVHNPKAEKSFWEEVEWHNFKV